MAAYSLEDAKAKYRAYSDAEEKVLTGQSYTLGGRSLTRANLAEIRSGMQYWEGKINRLEKTGQSGPVCRSIIPHG